MVHRTRERTRLRVPSRRDDAEFFEQAHAELSTTVGEVRVNPGTGSILLLHSHLPGEALDALLRDSALFDLSDEPVPPVRALEPLRAGVSRLDRAIAGMTAGAADLRTVLFVVAVALAIRQLLRGNVLGPAVPLLWMALELAGRIAASIERDDGSEGESPAGENPTGNGDATAGDAIGEDAAGDAVSRDATEDRTDGEGSGAIRDLGQAARSPTDAS